ncbi:MAG: hypothetical protein ACUVQQ_00515 [Thermogutta sp.]
MEVATLASLASLLIYAQESSSGSGSAWAPGYLVVILTVLLALMVALAPSRRRSAPRNLEFEGTTWGKVLVEDGKKKEAAQAPPGVFNPAQAAKQARK